MSFFAGDRWVWDFWIADDGENFHLFFLNAPRSLGNPDLRHRNATIGHAVGSDLRTWSDRGVALQPGSADSFDATATWTGCVLREETGRWRMFYTGSRFLDPMLHTNVETVGSAVSDDLGEWSKRPGPVLRADGRWYETLDDGTWHEEAWRDPWVWRDSGVWKMLLTARSKPSSERVDARDAGVVAVATSVDLDEWTVGAPASAPGAGFAHLEVLQPFTWQDSEYVLFSCDTAHLAGERAARGDTGGIWVAPAAGDRFMIEESRLLVDEWLYAGRIVRDRDGRQYLMGFVNAAPNGDFDGSISDPIPLISGADGWPAVDRRTAAEAG